METLMGKHEIMPDVIPKVSLAELNVSFGNIKVQGGNELTPTQVKNAPTVEWQGNDQKLYTLIMFDPDAPSRDNPKFRSYQHWLVTNIPGKKVSAGEAVVGYMGAGPPKGSNLHRYILLMYEQPGKINYDRQKIPKTSSKGRGKFDVKKFATDFKLNDPVAGNFFQAKWDTYVPTLYKQMND